MNKGSNFRAVLPRNDSVLIALAGIKLLIPLLTYYQYGYFRDELYYIACSEHLDFGYVDHPPLCAVILAITRPILGDSLYALRFSPALAGAFLVFLTGRLAREMSGDRFAEVPAALSALIMPVFLATQNMYSMNAFDQLFWVLSAYIIVLLLKEETPSRWIVLGLVMGIGLLNKISMLFFGFGFLIGLLLTPHRKFLLHKWIWITGSLAGLIFLPHIVWQIQHGWPALEFIHNASTVKNYPVSPIEFVTGQLILVHPFLLPVCLLGLYYYFISAMGKPFRLLGWIFVTVFVLLLACKGKGYYLAPAYPILFAAGGIMIESFVKRLNWGWLKPAIILVLAIGGLVTAPLALPVLPVELYISYSQALGIQPPPVEKLETAELPQHFADMCGWKEMVEAVAGVYAKLTPEEQSQCAILAENYGQAGAIDFFGAQYGLPKAICPHNNYYLWGPRDYTGDLVISLLGEEKLHRYFDEVTQVGIIIRKYSMPYENNRPIYLCRKPRVSLQEAWPELRFYI
ncbi:MAG: glycosyltransferase family 39 protein [bacterium]